MAKLVAAPAALGLAALITAGAAPAQLRPEAPIGTRIPVRPKTMSQDKASTTMVGFAACVVKKQRSLASEFILDRTTLGFPSKYKPLADGYCLADAYGDAYSEVALSMGGDTMRYAFAEALLKDELATIDPARLANAGPLTLPIVDFKAYEPRVGKRYDEGDLKALDEERSRARTSLILYRFGDCAVRADPMNARALLESTPNTLREDALLNAMMPAFGNCLERGSTIKLNAERLRGAVAFSYYALAHAPAARP